MSIQERYERSLVEWSDIQGHLEFMHDLVIDRDAHVVVELGVRDGVSTCAFLDGLRGHGGELWSVDTSPKPPLSWSDPRWTFVQGDDTDPEVMLSIPQQIDVLFIDTSHHYRHTLLELCVYGPRAKVILMHDVDLEWPWQAPTEDGAIPVRRAIEEWMAHQPGRDVVYREGSYGLAVIT